MNAASRVLIVCVITACVHVQAGANMIVSGSAVIRSTDPSHVMSLMRKTVVDAIQKHYHVINGS